MVGFLFHEMIFGPVRSRRLGLSLGINLLPTHSKRCSFNCIYCECGWTPVNNGTLPDFPSRELVKEYLAHKLMELAEEDYLPDAITYAGNGEPTLHPEFAAIVDDTIALRNLYSPKSHIAVLSNASRIHKEDIFGALLKVDDNIQKLDAGSEKIFHLMNNPVDPIKLEQLVEDLSKFDGKVAIQSMFLRGYFKKQLVDNTTDEEVGHWLEQLSKIRPKIVMIYPIARATPVHNLEKITTFELEQIAGKVRELGLDVKVYT